MSPQAGLLASLSTASDGFFLNLSWVLLRLCLPFMLEGGAKRSARIASIDSTYCSVGREDRGQSSDEPLVVDFSDDAKLVPGKEILMLNMAPTALSENSYIRY